MAPGTAAEQGEGQAAGAAASGGDEKAVAERRICYLSGEWKAYWSQREGEVVFEDQEGEFVDLGKPYKTVEEVLQYSPVDGARPFDLEALLETARKQHEAGMIDDVAIPWLEVEHSNEEHQKPIAEANVAQSDRDVQLASRRQEDIPKAKPPIQAAVPAPAQPHPAPAAPEPLPAAPEPAQAEVPPSAPHPVEVAPEAAAESKAATAAVRSRSFRPPKKLDIAEEEAKKARAALAKARKQERLRQAQEAAKRREEEANEAEERRKRDEVEVAALVARLVRKQQRFEERLKIQNALRLQQLEDARQEVRDNWPAISARLKREESVKRIMQQREEEEQRKQREEDEWLLREATKLEDLWRLKWEESWSCMECGNDTANHPTLPPNCCMFCGTDRYLGYIAQTYAGWKKVDGVWVKEEEE